MPTVFDTVGPNSILGVDVDLIQSVNFVNFAIETSVASDSNPNPETVFNGTSVQFLATSGTAAVQEVAGALFVASPLIAQEFFEGLGGGIGDLLTQPEFSVPVPLTDIDLADAFEGIADVFTSIPDIFKIQPEDFGFSDSSGLVNPGDLAAQFPSVALGPDITEVSGIDLRSSEIAALAALGEISFDRFTYNETSETFDVSTATIDLSDLDPFDIHGELKDETQFLQDFATTISDEFTAIGFGWILAAVGNQINFVVPTPGGGPVPTIPGTLALKSTSLRSDGTDAALTFKDFGIRTSNMQVLEGVGATGQDVDALRVQNGVLNIELEELNQTLLRGMDTVRFLVVVNGVYQTVDVDKPLAGWDPAAGSMATDRLDVFIDQMNAAMTNMNIDIEASRNTADDGLKLSLRDPLTSDQNIQIGLAPDTLTRAFSLKGLFTWFENEFSQLDCIPEFAINVDMDDASDSFGDITLGFAQPMTKTLTIGAGANDTQKSLDINDLGLGDIEGLTLQAQLTKSRWPQAIFWTGTLIAGVAIVFVPLNLRTSLPLTLDATGTYAISVNEPGILTQIATSGEVQGGDVVGVLDNIDLNQDADLLQLRIVTLGLAYDTGGWWRSDPSACIAPTDHHLARRRARIGSASRVACPNCPHGWRVCCSKPVRSGQLCHGRGQAGLYPAGHGPSAINGGFA